MASYDLRREVVVAKFQVLIDAINELDGNTDEIEAKLDSIITLLTSIDTKVATEATLLALETTANAMEVLLTSIDGKVATEATLDLIRLQTDKFNFTGGALDVNATISTAGLATEATLSAIKAQTDLLNFTGDKLRTTGEDGGAGGGAPFLIFGTTTPLGASATFASGILSLVGKSQVETRVSSDTDGTLIFDFYEDAGGLDLVRSLSIPYDGTSGYQYFAAPAFSNYVEYSFINSATPQTDFLYETKVLTTAINGQIVRLDGTIASGMVAPVTRSVITGIDSTGSYGNVKITPSREVATALFDSQTGSRQIVDLNGAAKVGEAFILAGDAFYGQTLNPLQWDTAFVGSGSETALPGTHRINTGTTANSKTCLQTVKEARFMIAQFNIAHFGVQLDPLEILDQNCIRRFGVFDPVNNGNENGLFFEVSSDDGINPKWCVVSIKNGVETSRTEQANFNGSSAELFNPFQLLAAYEIQYNAGTAFFFQGSNFIHRIGGLSETYAGTYNFKVGFSVENINGNTTDNKLEFRAGGVYRLGEPTGDPIGRSFTTDTLVKTGTGFINNASLSRTGSSGGSGSLEIYDGIDNTGILMGRIDVGGDDLRQITIKGTFTTGLFIDISGSGTNTANLSFE